MNARRILGALLFPAAVLAIDARAQNNAPGAQESVPEPAAADAMRSSAALVSPDLNSAIRQSAPTVVLQADRGKEEVSAQAGLTSGYWSAVLKATSPLNKDADDTELGGTIGGLTPGTTVTFTLGGQHWGPRRRQITGPAWCRGVQGEGRLAQSFDCSKFDKDMLPENLRGEYLATTAFAYRPVLFALEASAGPRSFRYMDPTTLVPASEDHWEASVTGAVGIVTAAGLFSAGAAYTASYQTASQRNVCTPLAAVAGALECRTLAFGAPQEERGFSGLAEMKSFLSAALAVNPRVRFNDQEWVLEAPLYFLPASGGGLIGGVTPRYSSETDRFGLVLFVGKAFGLNLSRLQ